MNTLQLLKWHVKQSKFVAMAMTITYFILQSKYTIPYNTHHASAHYIHVHNNGQPMNTVIGSKGREIPGLKKYHSLSTQSAHSKWVKPIYSVCVSILQPSLQIRGFLLCQCMNVVVIQLAVVGSKCWGNITGSSVCHLCNELQWRERQSCIVAQVCRKQI